jgi:uncharacterized GH25 family protein
MRHLFFIFLGILLLPFSALAHQYWIEPNEFFFYSKTKAMDKKVSESLTFEFTGGDTYFNADVNRTHDPEAYSFTYLTPNGKALKPVQVFNGKNRRVIEANATQKGTYTLGISRTGAPMYYSKLADDSWVAKSKDQLTYAEKTGLKVSGGYFQHTKSYVTLHTPTDSWKKPVGHTLEIMPLSHPNKLFAGNVLRVKVLYKGAPLTNTTLVGIAQGDRAKKHGETAISTTTNERGIARLPFDWATRWLITVTHAETLENNPKANLHEHKASLMLEVNEPWVKEWVK